MRTESKNRVHIEDVNGDVGASFEATSLPTLESVLHTFPGLSEELRSGAPQVLFLGIDSEHVNGHVFPNARLTFLNNSLAHFPDASPYHEVVDTRFTGRRIAFSPPARVQHMRTPFHLGETPTPRTLLGRHDHVVWGNSAELSVERLENILLYVNETGKLWLPMDAESSTQLLRATSVQTRAERWNVIPATYCTDCAVSKITRGYR